MGSGVLGETFMKTFDFVLNTVTISASTTAQVHLTNNANLSSKQDIKQGKSPSPNLGSCEESLTQN